MGNVCIALYFSMFGAKSLKRSVLGGSTLVLICITTYVQIWYKYLWVSYFFKGELLVQMTIGEICDHSLSNCGSHQVR